MHETPLIATIAIGFVLALLLGLLANRLRLPPLVGYLLAGVVMGRFAGGAVADTALTGQLAEVGVILLMFGVGLHFSVSDLLAVRRIALPGALVEIVLATSVGLLLTRFWGWSLGGGLVLGLCLSVASTVVLLKALEERNAVTSINGRIGVGWLIVEDLAMVLTLVLLPVLAEVLGAHGGAAAAHAPAHGGGHSSLGMALLVTISKAGAFVALVLIVGPKLMPWLLRRVARTGSRELFTLSVLAIALGIAYGSARFFGVSFALGAFFAGMVLNESALSSKAASNSLPLQDAFAVLFFISVGMLFDPAILVQQPLRVAAVVGVILLGKSTIAMSLVLTLGFPLSTAVVVAGSLTQIGEFSFVLAGLGVQYGLLPPEGLSLILSGAIISITINPAIFSLAVRASKWIQAHPSCYGLERRGQPAIQQLEKEISAAHERARQRAADRPSFTPEELVARFPMFADLSPEQREVILLHFEQKIAEPGERVIRQGDRADAMYFISCGEVTVRVPSHPIKLKAGDFFGEMALVSGDPRSADVNSVDYSTFLTLSARDFREIVRRYPEIGERIAALATQRRTQNAQFATQPSVETGLPA